ncbi:hypothetical protein M5D96_013188 [Drosophila gunungcola]|uniref:C2H2-type domain-containing protein n=1 Tax=Drosophila gunungcola TaxID=103775 RepID=A0A9P9YCI8_9MUSC|nr:hypothetical protein M5D96_013188 [Drosophila gunungcola]
MLAMKQEPGTEATVQPAAPETGRTASAPQPATPGSDEENAQDTGLAPLSCSFCSRHLKSVNALRRHIASRHSEIQGKEHECFICMKSFKTKWSLSTHNSRFHREMGCSTKGFTKIEYSDH